LKKKGQVIGGGGGESIQTKNRQMHFKVRCYGGQKGGVGGGIRSKTRGDTQKVSKKKDTHKK